MPLTILVADDDLGTRLSISDYLEAAGYSVVAAENGEEALKLVDTYLPHLIVTDIAMPRMDGYEFVRQLRQRPALRLLPVIFLTAKTETQERIRGYELGCDVYLSKPFDLQELGAVVRNLLERLQMIEREWRYSSSSVTLAAESIVAPKPPQPESNPVTIVPPLIPLTQRETEVLKVLAAGLSNVQIGEQLHLSPRTIEKYVSSLLRKTDTNNRAELVRYAMEHRLVE
jgi:DNA-binding NarL/FixJ family response regulator